VLGTVLLSSCARATDHVHITHLGSAKDNTVEEDCLMPPLNGARVLVIENDPFVAAELDLLVEDAGGEVVALAGSHRVALTLLGREPVDAAIVGRDLPEGEGTSIGEELGGAASLGVPSLARVPIYRGRRLKAGAKVRHVPGNHQLRKRRH
jgi:hypothetical protein